MADALVIKTTDVTGAPVNATVQVQLNINATPSSISKRKDPGVAVAALPLGAAVTATIKITAAGFFDVRQDVKLDGSAGLIFPEIDFVPPQHLNATLVTIGATLGGRDFEVHFVLGQLRDATAKIEATLQASGLSLVMPSKQINDVQAPMLNPTGTKSGVINVNNKTISTIGAKAFVAERVGDPRLIAMVHPGFPAPAPGQLPAPLPYHLFFPPPAPDDFGPDYPFAASYCDFIGRYLLFLRSENNKSIFKKLGLAYQGLVLGAQNVLVLPVPHATLPLAQQMGDLDSQAKVLRLLQEVNFFIQRMTFASLPTQPVGPVALSCFSAGVRFLSKVVSGPKVPEFFDNLLRHIFLFDAWFPGANGQADAVTFSRTLLAWHRSGAALRGLRVYTQFNVWQTALEAAFQALPGASVRLGFGGAKETDGPSATLLFAPQPFWTEMDPIFDPQNSNPTIASAQIHDAIPAAFLSHAMKRSQFSP
jgi:hypothetical protein